MTSSHLLRMLMLSTALVAPAVHAQTTDNPSPPPAPAASEPSASPDISIPGGRSSSAGDEDGGEIIVRGRHTPNVLRETPQVVSVLSAADIARTGEGDIAGSLQRVTGLSVVGNGYVFVRGLGDRYSLALLNGSPLPSPEPLRRVVPLDLFPTNLIASTLVQKSYSVNFPGEYGGGVINLTTRAIPEESFLSISGGIGADSETTGSMGYTYYGSRSDWTGFDNGARDVPPLLAAAMHSGKPILEGADFSRRDIQAMMMQLGNSNTSVIQRTTDIPFNFSGNITAGTSFDIGDGRIGLIATAGISNKWRTRDTLQQSSVEIDLSGTPQTSYQRVITDNRVVANAMLGVGAEFGEHRVRWTSLFIRDTLKQARLAVGRDQNQPGRDIMKQDTAWYERQLINTQLVGEFDFGPLQLDLRGSYANSQREAPYERGFTYVRTNLPTTQDPTGNKFVNDLGGNRGDATIAFSDLNEDLWSGGIDLSYEIAPRVTASIGYAYSDTSRTSVRRAFQFRGSNLPLPVIQLRPDYLLSDSTIQHFGISMIETSAQDGTAAFAADLTNHAAYAQLQAPIVEALTVNLGVRYEKAKQTVAPIDLFNSGASAIARTNLNNDYWLPAITFTWEMAPGMQFRASGSRTIARPQFRELVAQVYQDPESNRLFRGNPSLTDSRLWNAEARYEFYFGRDQRLTLASFYKRIENPIEAFTSISDSSVNTSYANAPTANLWGIEVEGQKYFELSNWEGAFWANRRVVLIANYTYTQSQIRVRKTDKTIVNGQSYAASDFFFNRAPLTGQSDHIGNLQLGLEDTETGSQQTLILTYASPRVTSRGPSGQPDVMERPGLSVDFVARQPVNLFNQNMELKFEARNLTGRRYTEEQRSGANRIYLNRYDLGTTVTVSATLNF